MFHWIPLPRFYQYYFNADLSFHSSFIVYCAFGWSPVCYDPNEEIEFLQKQICFLLVFLFTIFAHLHIVRYNFLYVVHYKISVTDYIRSTPFLLFVLFLHCNAFAFYVWMLRFNFSQTKWKAHQSKNNLQKPKEKTNTPNTMVIKREEWTHALIEKDELFSYSIDCHSSMCQKIDERHRAWVAHTCFSINIQILSYTYK